MTTTGPALCAPAPKRQVWLAGAAICARDTATTVPPTAGPDTGERLRTAGAAWTLKLRGDAPSNCWPLSDTSRVSTAAPPAMAPSDALQRIVADAESKAATWMRGASPPSAREKRQR